MQLMRIAMFAGSAVLAVSHAWADATSLIAIDEPVATLASPTPANPPFQYANNVATLVMATPLLCGNTSAPTGTSPTGVLPVYYSLNGRNGSSSLPFVFGAAYDSPTMSAVAYGATGLSYNGNQVQFGGDPLDALVCYGLDANGVRRVTRDLFADGFGALGTEGILGNSTVALNVVGLPTSGNGYYYLYTIDVTIPPLPNGTDCNVLDCNFALVEGYDTSVFDTTGQWCLAQTGNPTSCGPLNGGTSPANGDLNINFSNYTSFTPNISLAAPIAPAPAKQFHFYAYRHLKSPTSLPASGAPVVVAALFSPLDLQENKLDDNVATGNNTLANNAPTVVSDGALATFTTSVASLQEDTDSGTLTFNISDSDSSESPGNLLHASVVLNLPNGIQVPVVPNCGTTTPITTAPVNRTCTIDIPLQNGGFWNGSVAAAYQGQFNNVATDVANGTYASGVTASVQITTTDARGKAGAVLSLPVHVNSTKNDAPVVTFDANQMPSVADPNDSNNNYPTYSCTIPNCGSQFHVVTLDGSVTALPGPGAAFDELASQTTAANDLQCVADGTAPALTFSFNPVITPSNGSQTAYDVAFQLPNTLAAGSSLCTITMTDVGSFPNAESAATTLATFRVVVNP